MKSHNVKSKTRRHGQSMGHRIHRSIHNSVHELNGTW